MYCFFISSMEEFCPCEKDAPPCTFWLWLISILLFRSGSISSFQISCPGFNSDPNFISSWSEIGCCLALHISIEPNCWWLRLCLDIPVSGREFQIGFQYILGVLWNFNYCQALTPTSGCLSIQKQLLEEWHH
jgi:hypothetical protein